MRHILKYCIILAGVFLLSCNSSNPRIEIENILQKIIEADNQEKIGVLVDLYHKEAILMPPSGAEVKGIKAIEEHYSKLFETYDFKDLGLESHETIISDNWAVNIGITKGTIVFTATDSTMQVNDKYMMIFKKNNSGEWKISHLIWNKNP